jgi:hypothetical protein
MGVSTRCLLGSRRDIRSSSELAHCARSNNVEIFGRRRAGVFLSGRGGWEFGFVMLLILEKGSIERCVECSHYRAFVVLVFIRAFARVHSEAALVETSRSPDELVVQRSILFQVSERRRRVALCVNGIPERKLLHG